MYRDIKRDIEAGTLTIKEYTPYGALKGSLTISEEGARDILAGRQPPGFRVHKLNERGEVVMIAARDGSGLVLVALDELALALNIEAMHPEPEEVD